jgi:2-polyprenyl-6-methoxyphenol hydroxylase-like FAD-dependent oxidoreductase
VGDPAAPSAVRHVLVAGAGLAGTAAATALAAGGVAVDLIEKIWGPGRHLPGNNTFSYFLDPHGNTVEYTTELERVDEDTWHPHLYDFTQPEVADQWGTANAINEFVAAKSFNQPDRGLFTAPPV